MPSPPPRTGRAKKKKKKKKRQSLARSFAFGAGEGSVPLRAFYGCLASREGSGNLGEPAAGRPRALAGYVGGRVRFSVRTHLEVHAAVAGYGPALQDPRPAPPLEEGREFKELGT